MRKTSKLERIEMIHGYLAISPWFIGFLVLNVFPIVATLYFSFTQWTIVEKPVWVGIHNYERMMFSDPLFRKAIVATLKYVAFSLPLKLVFGLALSLLLNQKLKGMNFFRTVFYIPAVISGVAVSLMWIWLLQPDYGLVNTLLSYIGIDGPKWFWDPNWSVFSIALMSIWTVGGSAVIYLAGLQNIPEQLYEAASIDGASRWKSFWLITIPLLTPTLFFQLLMELIESFKIFTQAYVITQGGPLKSTYFLMLYIYEESFKNFNMGYASALTIFLTFTVLILTIILNTTSKRWVYAEADDAAAK
ncbi:MAG: sugar ABC transporter permease [Anaerolineaceae bacterium]|nr:sugar ABC transporter permease [Anaerolineaceae bacterium]